jgi:hypothetical protein
VTVWTDERCNPAVHRQSERACGGSEGSGGAGSSCEPSHGGFVGHAFGAGSVYPLEALWFVCECCCGALACDVVWCGSVVGNGGETRLIVYARRCGGGCVCGVRGDDWEDAWYWYGGGFVVSLRWKVLLLVYLGGFVLLGGLLIMCDQGQRSAVGVSRL